MNLHYVQVMLMLFMLAVVYLVLALWIECLLGCFLFVKAPNM